MLQNYNYFYYHLKKTLVLLLFKIKTGRTIDRTFLWLNSSGRTFIYFISNMFLLYFRRVILVIIVYIVLSLAVAYMGKDRTVGFLYSLILCLFMTPFVGLYVVLNSSKLILYHMVQYECPECGKQYSNNPEYCPSCLKKGNRVAVTPTIIPAT